MIGRILWKDAEDDDAAAYYSDYMAREEKKKRARSTTQTDENWAVEQTEYNIRYHRKKKLVGRHQAN